METVPPAISIARQNLDGAGVCKHPEIICETLCVSMQGFLGEKSGVFKNLNPKGIQVTKKWKRRIPVIGVSLPVVGKGCLPHIV